MRVKEAGLSFFIKRTKFIKCKPPCLAENISRFIATMGEQPQNPEQAAKLLKKNYSIKYQNNFLEDIYKLLH